MSFISKAPFYSLLNENIIKAKGNTLHFDYELFNKRIEWIPLH